MSNHRNRKVSRRPRPAAPRTAPVIPSVAEAATADIEILAGTEVTQILATPVASSQATSHTTASASTLPDREAVVEAHFERISGLLRQAEAVAEAMLAGLLQKVQRRETVYPGELIQICRGLHVLARCTTELGRTGRKTAAGQLTSAQVEQLEARLRRSFGM